MKCRSCGAQDTLRREHRSGFLQKKVFPIFGLFPWECSMCRKVRLYRMEFKLHRSKEKREYQEKPDLGKVRPDPDRLSSHTLS